MERMTVKKNIYYILRLIIFLIILIPAGTHKNTTALAFFEEQAKYVFLHQWYPMLSDSAPEKRFQAARAFLNYPEWGLPVLRNTILNQDTESVPWQIAMLTGMLGDSTDVPPLLKIWKESESKEHSTIWLGALKRLYWKNRVPDSKIPILTSLSVSYSEESSDAEKSPVTENDKKVANLMFRIDNPASAPRFIKVSSNFWQTQTQENIDEKYYWIPAGGRIESSLQAQISPVSHVDYMRLDFRIWEVGVPDPLIHQTGEIPFIVE